MPVQLLYLAVLFCIISASGCARLYSASCHRGYKEKDPTIKIRLYDHCLAENILEQEDYLYILSDRSSAYAALHLYGLAIDDLELFVREKPDNPNAFFNIGIYWEKAGYPHMAIPNFSRTIELDPEDWQAYLYRASNYAFELQWEKTIDDLHQVVRLKPDYYKAYTRLGIAHARIGQYDQAIAELDKGIARYPEKADGYGYKGMAYALSGQCDLAEEQFRKTDEIDPNRYIPLTYRALCFEKSGQKSLAKRYYHKALAVYPEDSFTLERFITLLLTTPAENEMPDRREAITLAEQLAYEKKIPPPQSLEFLAAVYAEFEMFAKAEKTQTRALSLAEEEDRKRQEGVLAGYRKKQKHPTLFR